LQSPIARNGYRLWMVTGSWVCVSLRVFAADPPLCTNKWERVLLFCFFVPQGVTAAGRLSSSTLQVLLICYYSDPFPLSGAGRLSQEGLSAFSKGWQRLVGSRSGSVGRLVGCSCHTSIGGRGFGAVRYIGSGMVLSKRRFACVLGDGHTMTS